MNATSVHNFRGICFYGIRHQHVCRGSADLGNFSLGYRTRLTSGSSRKNRLSESHILGEAFKWGERDASKRSDSSLPNSAVTPSPI